MTVGLRGLYGKQILELPKGLVYCLNTDLTPGSSNYIITLPSNISSFTSVTYAVVFTPPSTMSGTRDLLTDNIGGENPRITFNENGSITFYYVGASPFFDMGFSSANGRVIGGVKNIFIGRINGTAVDGWINGVNAADSRFNTGTARTGNWNKVYRLSGFPDNTLLFNGTYNFFGIWNRGLRDDEINTLNNIL